MHVTLNLKSIYGAVIDVNKVLYVVLLSLDLYKSMVELVMYNFFSPNYFNFLIRWHWDGKQNKNITLLSCFKWKNDQIGHKWEFQHILFSPKPGLYSSETLRLLCHCWVMVKIRWGPAPRQFRARLHHVFVAVMFQQSCSSMLKNLRGSSVCKSNSALLI